MSDTLTKEQFRVLFGSKEPDAYQPITESLDQLVQAVEARLTFGDRERTIAETLEAKWGPKDHWRRADDPEREADRKAANDLHEQHSGEDLFRLDHTAHRHRQEIETLVARASAAPDAVQVWAQRAGTSTDMIPASEALWLAVLDELRQARHERELSELQPSEVHARYVLASRDPLDQANASLMRFVEARHGETWCGAQMSHEEAIAGTSGALLKDIKAARAARVPEAARKALELIVKAERLVEQAKARRIRPQRPDGWKAA